MGAEKFTFFWSGPFSQWYRAAFVVEGVTYNTAEQYMMAGKARLFGDESTLRKILAATNPRSQKTLGRQVASFDEAVWDRVARSVVYVGNWHKFSQNDDLGKQLLATVGTTLVEASPNDRIWGIGLAEDDPLARRRETWRGKNWLGEVLTAVREDLVVGQMREYPEWASGDIPLGSRPHGTT